MEFESTGTNTHDRNCFSRMDGEHELEMEFRVNMLMNFILIFQHIESISCGKYVRIFKCVFN